MARRSLLSLLIFVGALLGACAQQPAAQQPAAQAPPTAVSPMTTASPPPATAPPPTMPPAPGAPSVAAAPDGPFAGIPQSRTAEGYQVLGSPDAAATLVMYSDFL